MNFGLYLFEKNLINEKALMDGLETQYQELPNLIHILRKDLEISDQILVQVLKKQDQENLSIIEALKSSSDISDDVLASAIAIQNKRIKTIAEILIDHNVLNDVEIQTHIDEYLAQTNSTAATDTHTEQKATPEPKAAASSDNGEPSVNQAAIDSMKEIFGADSPEVKEMEAQLAAAQASASSEPASRAGESAPAEKSQEDGSVAGIDEDFFACKHQIDMDFVSELILKFNAKEIVELSKSLKSIQTNSSVIPETLQKLHIILGASKLAGTKVLSTSLTVLENFLHKLDPNSITNDQAEKVYQFFSLIVKLRNHIEQEKSESDFFDEANRKAIYSDIHQYLTT